MCCFRSHSHTELTGYQRRKAPYHGQLTLMFESKDHDQDLIPC
jgi:hypothetical protein